MSIQRTTSRLWMAAVIAASMVATGCKTAEPAPAKPAEAPLAAPTSADCPVYVAKAPAGMTVNTLAFPTGSVKTSAIMLSTVFPTEVRAGQPYSYELHVTNLTNATLQSVVVYQTQATNLDVSKSTPEGRVVPSGYAWDLNNLGPCETRVIKVDGRADAVGMSSTCMSVTYNNLLCTAVKVTQPALAITKTAPAEVLICDVIPMVLEVRNTGTGTASGVKVTDSLPAGLKTTEGQQNVTADLGDIGPGQSKRVTINAKADRTGSYQNSGTASAAGNLTAQSNTTTTVVRSPKLEIACQAPEKIFIGRDASFAFTVKNSGDAASRDTVVSMPLPAGTTFVSATDGGVASASGVNWNVGVLAPNASKTVTATLRPAGAEVVRASATASGVCASPVTANCVTTIEGIPAVLLEVIDLVDPVEVGGQTTYVITATNQGSVALNNLAIIAELAAGQDFVSASGASTATAAGKKVTFALLPSLAPKAKAEWRVVVKAAAEGDQRILVTLSTARFAKPIEETESTNQYK